MNWVYGVDLLDYELGTTIVDTDFLNTKGEWDLLNGTAYTDYKEAKVDNTVYRNPVVWNMTRYKTALSLIRETVSSIKDFLCGNVIYQKFCTL